MGRNSHPTDYAPAGQAIEPPGHVVYPIDYVPGVDPDRPVRKPAAAKATSGPPKKKAVSKASGASGKKDGKQ